MIAKELTVLRATIAPREQPMNNSKNKVLYTLLTIFLYRGINIYGVNVHVYMYVCVSVGRYRQYEFFCVALSTSSIAFKDVKVRQFLYSHIPPTSSIIDTQISNYDVVYRSLRKSILVVVMFVGMIHYDACRYDHIHKLH